MRARAAHEVHAPPGVVESTLEIGILAPPRHGGWHELRRGTNALSASAWHLVLGCLRKRWTRRPRRTVRHLVHELCAQQQHESPLLERHRPWPLEAEHSVCVWEKSGETLLPDRSVVHGQRAPTSEHDLRTVRLHPRHALARFWRFPSPFSSVHALQGILETSVVFFRPELGRQRSQRLHRGDPLILANAVACLLHDHLHFGGKLTSRAFRI